MTSTLPEEEKARLTRNEAAQRRETAKRGLPAVPVSVEGLWLIQRGCCGCDECRCEVPLVVGKIVIAHRHFRGGVGSPGHMPHNVQLWNEDCNKREAPLEVSAKAKGERMAVDLTRTKADPKKSKWQKPKVSPLSKDHWKYSKHKWPKRRMGT
ncbi:hypothetical protein [Henriciella pelagia]|uniref:hypothetical protein n=1 Tax=Henriciella pelagia TaxID=1977912 RepID=UPI003513170F